MDASMATSNGLWEGISVALITNHASCKIVVFEVLTIQIDVGGLPRAIQMPGRTPHNLLEYRQKP